MQLCCCFRLEFEIPRDKLEVEVASGAIEVPAGYKARWHWCLSHKFRYCSEISCENLFFLYSKTFFDLYRMFQNIYLLHFVYPHSAWRSFRDESSFSDHFKQQKKFVPPFALFSSQQNARIWSLNIPTDSCFDPRLIFTTSTNFFLRQSFEVVAAQFLIKRHNWKKFR